MTTISLKALDVGFNLRLQGQEVILPPGHLEVVTDDATYHGEAGQVARQMRVEGWRVKVAEPGR